jgi:hypothetical protein
MYGGEYQAYNDAVFEQDAPCSVCLNKNAHSSIMIPGRNACYNGWNLEYRGVLVSGYYGHKAASTYICYFDLQRHHPQFPVFHLNKCR